ncbi:molybdenum ABC transporter ATP-binding protein, partial [Amphibiibacter pelophylacis]
MNPTEGPVEAFIDARFRLARPGFVLDVDLRLPGRGVTAVTGPSGCGKTTLLRCMAGLERAPTGRLSVNGLLWQDASVWLPPHQRTVGVVFQEASLFPHLSVMGNLRYGLKRSQAASRAALEETLDQAINLLGIEPLLDRRPNGLSGGERQRVAIARALATGPSLLLLDEPLAALDHRRRQDILPYLERLSSQLALPMIYVSHAPDEVVRLADHLVVMADGRATSSGPLAESLAQLDAPVRLGDEPGAILRGTVAEVDAHWHLMRVDLDGRPTLSLWVRDHDLQLGQRLRLRVLASDVSLAIQPGQTSIQNVLPARVEAIAGDDHPGSALVRVRLVGAGGNPLLARVT